MLAMILAMADLLVFLSRCMLAKVVKRLFFVFLLLIAPAAYKVHLGSGSAQTVVLRCQSEITVAETEMAVADQNWRFNQSQHSNTEPSSAVPNPLTPGA